MSPHLLPDPAHVRPVYLRASDDQITVIACSKATEARCPLCNQSSPRVHSRYTRTLADLPGQGIALQIRLTVRRFFCPTENCKRRIFAERLPDLTAPYARRTSRLSEALELVGFALGGEAGERLLAGLHILTSPDTILRLMRRAQLADRGSPRILGVDDFAFRRGHRYGTILVDLERHYVIDLLPDRKPETLIAWLEQHAAPEVISRDRGGGYGEAARRGAPEAIQVADRFHLTKNLVEALERVFLRYRSVLKRAASPPADNQDPAEQLDSSEEQMYRGKRTCAQNWEERCEEASLQRHAAHVARYEQVHALRGKGVAIAEIARRVGVARKTVYVYLRMDHPPERKRPMRNPKERVLAPYEPYLLKRWEEGCRNGLQLWREITEQGYAYSRASVARFVAGLRQDGAVVVSRSRITGGQGPPARRVALLTVQQAERLDEEETAYLAAVRAQDQTIDLACRLGQTFAQMARERQGARLDAWIADARASGIDELARFAAGLLTDEAAVRAGLTLVWSNGQVEGNVNRLKLIKRQMYGRASFDLLRQRVLYAG